MTKNPVSSEACSPESSWLNKLSLARSGDRLALGELLSEFWQPLWAHAKLTLDQNIQPKQAASDIVQETFVEAQSALEEFNGLTRREFYSWLRKILDNNIRDAWRKHAGTLKRNIDLERSLARADADNLLNADGTSPLDRVLKDERDSLVESLLVQLPENYRLVIRLRYWESLTFEQMGQVLDKSPDAVRQIWYRAIEYFTDLMEEHE
jgi:RNA polymerase sigma-70 factor (ECF subfamily)